MGGGGRILSLWLISSHSAVGLVGLHGLLCGLVVPRAARVPAARGRGAAGVGQVAVEPELDWIPLHCPNNLSGDSASLIANYLDLVMIVLLSL